jgi:hypothetical protein
VNRLKDFQALRKDFQADMEEARLGLRHAVLSEDGAVMECDLMTWAYWLEKGRAQRVLAQEELEGGYWISTVFLGLNHQYNPKGSPLWFETMIFAPPDGKPLELIRPGYIPKHGPEVFCDRYTTLAEALAGHESAKAAFQGRGLSHWSKT